LMWRLFNWKDTVRDGGKCRIKKNKKFSKKVD